MHPNNPHTANPMVPTLTTQAIGTHPAQPQMAINNYLAATSAAFLVAGGRWRALVLDTPLLLTTNALHAVGFSFSDVWVPNPNEADVDGIRVPPRPLIVFGMSRSIFRGCAIFGTRFSAPLIQVQPGFDVECPHLFMPS